jgi:riboflavin synthase
MFTGIIEALGTITALKKEGDNVHITLHSPFIADLKVDQSVAHNGACLTVVNIENNAYTVTAIDETLLKTTIGTWKVGDQVNLERCMVMGGRLDGHIVQGHVDTIGHVERIVEEDGSWRVYVAHPSADGMVDEGYVTVPKGSITVNGVSLTVVDSSPGRFSVAIIPYTWEHTNFHTLTSGSAVNLEFDIIGKYVARMLANQKS